MVGNTLQHGRRVTYTRYGCRCAACKAINRGYLAAYRARKRTGAPFRRYRQARAAS